MKKLLSSQLGSVAVLCLLVACGDDTTAGGGGSGGSGGSGANGGGGGVNDGAGGTGAGNTNGGGGSGAGSPDGGGVTDGGAPQGGGGGVTDGGAPQGGGGGVADGGAGGMGGEGGQGGGGMLPQNDGSNGSSCAADSDCDSDLCITEAASGLPGGLCVEDCTDSNTCPLGGGGCFLVDEETGNALCFRECNPAMADSCGAPNTLVCEGVAPTGVCFPSCDDNADCSVNGNICHTDESCAPPEDCNDITDNDLDGLPDCGDDECAADTFCTMACMNAPTLVVGTPVNNNTTGGLAGLPNFCALSFQGGGTGLSRLYKFTPPTTGGYRLTLNSASDQGVAVRSTCLDASTERTCADAEVGGTNEVLTFAGTAGVPLTIVVSAFSTGDEGAFTLTLTTVPSVAEVCSGFNDDDFDGSFDCADTTTCTGTAACTSGAGDLYAACTTNNNCDSSANDPACITVAAFGVASNFCSEWCNLAVDDCPAGSDCIDLGNFSTGPANQGLCFATCAVDADCPGATQVCSQGGLCVPG